MDLTKDLDMGGKGTANYTGEGCSEVAMLIPDVEGYYSIYLAGVSASKLGVVINNGGVSGTQQPVNLATFVRTYRLFPIQKGNILQQ